MRTFSIIALCVVLLTPYTTQALIVSKFGGTIAVVVPCTCQAGFALTIVSLAPPSVKVLLWQLPFTRPTLWFIPYPSVKTLGTYVRGGVCATGPLCIPLPVMGTIFRIGTSLK